VKIEDGYHTLAGDLVDPLRYGINVLNSCERQVQSALFAQPAVLVDGYAHGVDVPVLRHDGEHVVVVRGRARPIEDAEALDAGILSAHAVDSVQLDRIPGPVDKLIPCYADAVDGCEHVISPRVISASANYLCTISLESILSVSNYFGHSQSKRLS